MCVSKLVVVGAITERLMFNFVNVAGGEVVSMTVASNAGG